MAVESDDRLMRLREWSQSLSISLAQVTLAPSLIAVPLSAATQLNPAAVVATTAEALAEHLAQLVPEPMVVGLLAGSTLPFVADIHWHGCGACRQRGRFPGIHPWQEILGGRGPATFLAMVAGIAAGVALCRFGAACFRSLVFGAAVSWVLEREGINEPRIKAGD